jgi:hypothetical protein
MVSGGPIGCRSVVSVKGDPWRNKLRHGVGERVQAGAAGKWNSFVGRSARAQQNCNICNLDSLLIYAPSSNAHRWFLRCTYTRVKHLLFNRIVSITTVHSHTLKDIEFSAMADVALPHEPLSTQPKQIPRNRIPDVPPLSFVPNPQFAGVRNGHLSLGSFSPVNQNGSFEFDRVLKSGEVMKRTRKTKVIHSSVQAWLC